MTMIIYLLLKLILKKPTQFLFLKVLQKVVFLYPSLQCYAACKALQPLRGFATKKSPTRIQKQKSLKGSNDEARNLKQFHFEIIVNIIRFLIQRIFTVKSCSTVGSKRSEVSNRALNFYKHIIKNCVKNREIIVSIIRKELTNQTGLE